MSTRDNEPGGEPFEDALHNVFDRNERSGDGPASARALARALVLLDDPDAVPSHAKIEQWRRQLRRYMSGERQPRPDTLAKIATAAGATPDDFPQPRSREDLVRRLEELERENARLRDDLARRRRGHS